MKVCGGMEFLSFVTAARHRMSNQLQASAVLPPVKDMPVFILREVQVGWAEGWCVSVGEINKTGNVR